MAVARNILLAHEAAENILTERYEHACLPGHCKHFRNAIAEMGKLRKGMLLLGRC